jgi:hypothetical protein
LLDPIMDEAMATMPLSHSVDFTDKKRLAMDAEYSLGRNLWRGELVAGGDLEGGADGQLAQWNLALSDKDELMAQFVRWNQPGGTRSRIGAWYGHMFGKYITTRLWAEFSYGQASEDRGDGKGTAAGLQFLLEIPDLLRK